VLDQSHHFVFLIEDVPVRFFRGLADDPTTRTLRRNIIGAQEITMALGQEKAEGLVFRLAIEASAGGSVDRVVFLALRGEDGQVECFWPVPLEAPGTPVPGPEPYQMHLLGDDAIEVVVTRLGKRKSRGMGRGLG
jgi:hypothetical protein